MEQLESMLLLVPGELGRAAETQSAVARALNEGMIQLALPLGVIQKISSPRFDFGADRAPEQGRSNRSRAGAGQFTARLRPKNRRGGGPIAGRN